MLLAVSVVTLLVVRSASAAEGRTTVALDLTRLDDRQYSDLDGLALEKRLVLRLVEEGFAVVAPTAQPEITVHVEVQGDAIVLVAEQDGRTDQRQIAWDHQIELELLHLELAQKAVELVRSLSAAAPARAAPPAPTPPKPPNRVLPPIQYTPPPPKLAEPPVAKLALRIGGVWRPPSVDPMARLGLELRLVGPWRAELGAGAIVASAPGIHVVEVEPTAGIAAELELDQHWALSAGVRAGVLLHAYSLVDRSAEHVSGLHVDGLIAAPIRASVRVFGPIELDLTVAPGVATRGRSHVLDGATLWHRSPGQLEATLGLGMAF